MDSPVDTSLLNTMRIGGKAKSLFNISSPEDILNLTDDALVIGDGSNVVFGQDLPHTTIAKMEIEGIRILEENDREATLEVGAGENWDKFVAFCVNRGFSGAEALSGIPGTVGASPIQNIGAYGSEVKEIIVEVEAYDRHKKEFGVIKNENCEFSYRNSIFKKRPNSFIISKVIFRLSKNKKITTPNYKDVLEYFSKLGVKSPNISEVREVIIQIRKNKLPDPKIIPNCGSFFKNPIVNDNVLKKILDKFPNTPFFEVDTKFKIPAGFLIERAGFKGQKIGKIEVYKNNALVLTNPNQAKFDDLIYAKNKIQETVLKMFGILLESEVNIIQ